MTHKYIHHLSDKILVDKLSVELKVELNRSIMGNPALPRLVVTPSLPSLPDRMDPIVQCLYDAVRQLMYVSEPFDKALYHYHKTAEMATRFRYRLSGEEYEMVMLLQSCVNNDQGHA